MSNEKQEGNNKKRYQREKHIFMRIEGRNSVCFLKYLLM